MIDNSSSNVERTGLMMAKTATSDFPKDMDTSSLMQKVRKDMQWFLVSLLIALAGGGTIAVLLMN